MEVASKRAPGESRSGRDWLLLRREEPPRHPDHVKQRARVDARERHATDRGIADLQGLIEPAQLIAISQQAVGIQDTQQRKSTASGLEPLGSGDLAHGGLQRPPGQDKGVGEIADASSALRVLEVAQDLCRRWLRRLWREALRSRARLEDDKVEPPAGLGIDDLRQGGDLVVAREVEPIRLDLDDDPLVSLGRDQIQLKAGGEWWDLIASGMHDDVIPLIAILPRDSL